MPSDNLSIVIIVITRVIIIIIITIIIVMSLQALTQSLYSYHQSFLVAISLLLIFSHNVGD